jgi:hypothetical protein
LQNQNELDDNTDDHEEEPMNDPKDVEDGQNEELMNEEMQNENDGDKIEERQYTGEEIELLDEVADINPEHAVNFEVSSLGIYRIGNSPDIGYRFPHIAPTGYGYWLIIYKSSS